MEMQRLREKTKEGWVIHVEAPDGDARTLCGYAFEGTCIEGEGDSGVHPVARGKINCADCLRIIHFCQDWVPKRALAPLDRTVFHIERS
jgi:hypothetical protein